MMTANGQMPMVSTKADRPDDQYVLPADGSRLETRIAGDYFGVHELIPMMFGALMMESPYRCHTLMEECGDLFLAATESGFEDSPPQDQAAVLRLLYRLFEELDFYNYRIDLVKAASRHR